MSYSIKQAKDERTTEVYTAIMGRDSEALYRLADLYKEEGEDEKAEWVLLLARGIDREDIDEYREDRMVERYESEQYPAEGK